MGCGKVILFLVDRHLGDVLIHRAVKASMNLRDLSYLVAVAELRNFSQAAEQCSIGQPTLSTQIKKLEDYLGVDLFVREKNNVEITETCREILPIAHRILDDVQSIRQIAAHASDRHRNMLSWERFLR